MCYSGCPYENYEGQCKNRRETPEDAYCNEQEEEDEEDEEKVNNGV
jgi:hypothetical protein